MRDFFIIGGTKILSRCGEKDASVVKYRKISPKNMRAQINGNRHNFDRHMYHWKIFAGTRISFFFDSKHPMNSNFHSHGMNDDGITKNRMSNKQYL